ncbi:MAG: TlpA family protein disulfide reductase [Bacteroidia bacterium]
MKQFITLIAVFTLLCGVSFAQETDQSSDTDAAASTSSLPAVTLKDLEGNMVNFSEISNDGKPIVISFWATWCHPCVSELTAINDMLVDWEEETGVKIYAVSIDDARNTARVAPFANGRNWDFPVLLDANKELYRAMNVVNVPHTFLLDGDLNIVYQHTSYKPGDEEELYEHILELVEED